MIRQGIFPATLVLALLVTHQMLEQGSPPETVIVIWFGLMPVIMLLERVMPRYPEWNKNQGDLRADLIYFPTNLIVAGGFSALFAGAYLACATALQAWLGQTLWPSEQSLPVQVILACIAAEFFAYWAHRWMHAWPFLWRFHAVHHSPARVYWLNALRAHPGEHLFRGFISGAPLAVLGAPPEALAYWMVLGRVGGLFQHANIDFALGPFAWLFSIGELHRWHHSADRSVADHNFGDTFIIWDIVFGTRHLPQGEPAPQEVGIEEGAAYPQGWWGQMKAPFQGSVSGGGQ
ncbi:MAG: sterol desaturase family protein [Myxococcota bacterium]